MDHAETTLFMETCGESWLRDLFATPFRRERAAASFWRFLPDVDLDAAMLTIGKSLRKRSRAAHQRNEGTKDSPAQSS